MDCYFNFFLRTIVVFGPGSNVIFQLVVLALLRDRIVARQEITIILSLRHFSEKMSDKKSKKDYFA